MLLTLTLVVLVGSIVVFFSEEFIKSFKKLFKIKGATLFLPLFVASWLVYSFDFWFLWTIFYLREIVYQVLIFLEWIMPFQRGAESVSIVILLTTLSVVPVIIIDVIMRKKTYWGYKYPYITSGIIWIFCVFLLIVL
jgi:hypothetical protein